jgi:DNA-binding SARP family transcriptional activator
MPVSGASKRDHRWRLSTFGGASLRGEGDPSAVAAQRRPLALLALLAASGELGMSRDKLLLYLWPESDEEHARNALRQLLHTVRRGLKEPEVFLGTADLRLNPETITSDIAEFTAALERGDLAQAAGLYRGAFLDGFHLGGSSEFDYWRDAQRADYATRASAAMERLARTAGERGDVEGALGWWRRMAALEPLNGRVALELMRGLVAAGNAAGALQHARVHERLVREELGGAADPEIAALVERLRTASGSSAPSPTAAPAAVPLEPPRDEGDTQPAAAPAAPGGRGQLRERLQNALTERYTVERELARREGTTRVFLARDRRHDRAVALKVLHPALASALDLQRFLREVAVTARLQHPHLLPLLDSGEIAGRPWFATPDPGGETLRDRLAEVGRLPLAESLEIARQVADALAYAHGQGIIHRDVRPENILLAQGHALVTNFGLARAIQEAAGPKLTATGILVGAPAYMSPEQGRGEPADAGADIYSLGCVLHEMLVGEPPFTGPTPEAIMARRARAPGPPVWRGHPEIPHSVASVLAVMLAPAASERGSAQELGARLKDLTFSLAIAEANSGEGAPETLPIRQRRARGLLWVGGGVLASLLLSWLACPGS